MSTKAKIELIIKILLILMLVPIGVVSWAEQVIYSNDITSEPSEEEKGNPFAETTHFQYKPDYTGIAQNFNINNNNDTYTRAYGEFFSTGSIADYHLKYGRVFCLDDGNHSNANSLTALYNTFYQADLANGIEQYDHIWNIIEESFKDQLLNKDKAKECYIKYQKYLAWKDIRDKINQINNSEEAKTTKNDIEGHWLSATRVEEIFDYVNQNHDQTADWEDIAKNGISLTSTSDTSSTYYTGESIFAASTTLMSDYENGYANHSQIHQTEIKDKVITKQVPLGGVTQFSPYWYMFGTGAGNIINLSYALSFFNMKDPNGIGYRLNDECQKVLLYYYNPIMYGKESIEKGSIAQGLGPGAYDDTLRLANESYADYAALQRGLSEMGVNMEDAKLSVDEANVETYFDTNHEYVVVGPFYMSGHPYGEDPHGNVQKYSGKDLVEYPNCLGGLLNTNITITNEITKEEKSRDLEGKDYSICYDKYGTKAEPTDRTEIDSLIENIMSQPDIKVPEQYKPIKNNETDKIDQFPKVPCPDKNFYIKIKASEINKNDYLTNITLTARHTVADGEGYLAEYKYVTTDWTLQKTKATYRCDTCGEESNTKKSGTHNCSNWKEYDSKEYTEESHNHNKSSCFAWKEALEPRGDVYVKKTETKSGEYKYNNSVWYRCIREKCGVFEDWKKHIGQKMGNTNVGTKCNCGCNATIIRGINEGGNWDEEKEGFTNTAIYIGVRQDEEGFIKRINQHNEKYVENSGDMNESVETWYTQNGYENIKKYCLQPDDYILGKITDRKKLSCEKNFDTYYAKIRGFWINRAGKNIENGEYKEWWDISFYKNNVNSICGEEYEKDGDWGHIHTTKCYPDIKGKWVEDPTVKWNEATETKDKGLLIVKDCSTKVYKKTISLDLKVKLISDVSIFTHVDTIKNGKEENSGEYREYIDGIPNIKYKGEDWKTYGINDRCVSTYTDNDEKTEKTDSDVADVSNPSLWRSEEWKNNSHVVTAEAGDTMEYMIFLTNEDLEQVGVQIKSVLPNNISSVDISQVKVTNQNQQVGETKTVKKEAGKDTIVLTTKDFPGATLSGTEYYISLKGLEKFKNEIEERCFAWKLKVKIDTAQGSYNTSVPKQNIAQITGTYREDVEEEKGENGEPKGYYHDHVANIADLQKDGKRSESKDSFICKMYKVTVDKYISNVQRNNGKDLVPDEYTVDNTGYSMLNDERSKEKSALDLYKKQTPIYVENGDLVEYTIIVKNEVKDKYSHNAADASTMLFDKDYKKGYDSPYYDPNVVTVSLKDTLPTDKSEIKSISASLNKSADAGINDGKYFYYPMKDVDYNIGCSKDTTASGNVVKINDFKLKNEETLKITYTVLVNNDSNTTYDYYKLRENKVRIDKLTNVNGKTTTKGDDNCAYCKYNGSGTSVDNIANGGQILNNVKQDEAWSADYFRIKEYNVVIDKFIAKVEHAENRNGTLTTYNNLSRETDITDPTYKNDANGIRKVDNKGGSGGPSGEVSVEYGDKVTYQIKIFNTTNDDKYNVGRENAPYKQPQYIKLDLITDTLPNKFSNLTVTPGANTTITDNSVSGKTLSLTGVQVNAGTVGIITITLNVEEVTRELIETNTISFNNDRLRNINGYRVVNNGNRNTASDKYKLNDYNAKLEEYIDTYNAEMAKYNNKHEFTKDESEGFLGYKNNGKWQGYTGAKEGVAKYLNNAPLDLEKYETLTFGTKVTNMADDGEDENNTSSSAKYKTRVRPTDVKVTLDEGLQYTGYSVKWYNKDGSEKGTYTAGIAPQTTDNRIINYHITDENIILSPGEYLVYYTEAKVTESNMCLKNLKCYSQIITLTNVNRKNSTNYGTNNGVDKSNGYNRKVTGQNISTQTQDSDYVRLKDLVIAGRVWIDSNRDGLISEAEKGKKVTVKLYRTDQEDFETATINDDGYYTFGRQWKSFTKDKDKNYTSSGYINRYIEFEYDGVKYKATEIYGGDSDGNADGMHNLGGIEGSSTWIQGHNDLNNTVRYVTPNGDENYIKDSNAYEFDNIRNDFNSKYKTIGFNQAYNDEYSTMTSEQKDKYKLEYTKKDHKSELKENSNRVMRARSFIKQDYANTINESIENTHTLFLKDDYNYHNINPETEYLKFINLGLVEREQVDISVDADVYSVKTTINGEEMTYKYDSNTADSTQYDVDTENTEKHKNDYKLNQAYNLNLYKSDYYYRDGKDDYYTNEEDLAKYKSKFEGNEYKNESEMQAEVTYRIKIHNNPIKNDENYLLDGRKDIPVMTAINELAVYYDANFIKIDETNKGNVQLVKDKFEETGMFFTKEIPNIEVKYGTVDDINANRGADLLQCIKNTTAYDRNISPMKEGDKSNYNVLYLSGDAMNNEYIEEGGTRIIQIKFVVNKDTVDQFVRSLMINDTNTKGMGLEAIAEVNAYTTKYEKDYYHTGLQDTMAGLVDKDSNPGNIGNQNNEELDESDNYEDDTYKVGINVGLLDDSRTVSGIVWEDARSESLGESETAIQYLGNGENTINKATKDSKKENVGGADNDKAVSGVRVSLVEIVQTGEGKYYEYPARYTYDWTEKVGDKTIEHKKGDLVETISDENGKYTLSNYIPGYYKVRFDYGYTVKSMSNYVKNNITDSQKSDVIKYNGQDYKSTTYYNKENDDKTLYYNTNSGYGNDNIGSLQNFNYFDKVKTALGEENKSDALDDEIRRLSVNGYSETMTTKQAQAFSKAVDYAKYKGQREDNTKKAQYENSLTNNTHMYADSTIFYAKPESVDSNIESIIGDITNMKGQTGEDHFDTTRLWNIKNLDFGLEYRPESSIMLDKDVESVELVTSDKQTLVKMCFQDEEKDGTIVRSVNKGKSKGYENVQFMPGENGFIYINMDSDILEGCTIKVDYRIDSENQSDIDRINQNLDDIKFAHSANNKKYTGVYVSDNYNANLTAANVLAKQYFDDESYNKYISSNKDEQINDYEKGCTSKVKSFKKLKKPYESESTTSINNVKLKGSEYYGMYLGETYYTGKIGKNDKVAELKVDNILDYVDNNFIFEQSQNNAKNRLWKTVKSLELKNILDWTNVNRDGENLIDENGIKYDTENRSNLALSVDDNKSGIYYENNKYLDSLNGKDRIGNISLSRFLKPQFAVKDNDRKVTTYKNDVNVTSGAQQYIGRINLIASKILSAEDISQGIGLSYNNIAEAVQYTTLTGRRTKLPDDKGNGGVIGNGVINEDDTDKTEIITIAPPTGVIKH